MDCEICKSEIKKGLTCKVCGHKHKKKQPTEEELVKAYVKRTISNQVTHGRVNNEKFKGLERNQSVSKNIWMDQDFFFSVVFQSSEQKMQFLSQLKVGVDVNDRIQIVNGLKLAESMGIKLKKKQRGIIQQVI